jgi:hypothetical protein
MDKHYLNRYYYNHSSGGYGHLTAQPQHLYHQGCPGFLVDKETLGQIFLQVLQVYLNPQCFVFIRQSSER